MKLVVGLGNPGIEYKFNRHNAGFLFLDKYTAKRDIKFKKKIKYDIAIADEIIFIKPKTYMNRSGNAVTSIITKHRVDNIMVIVDDINLPLGEIRFRKEGGYGGHNGLKSIGAALGTDKFNRFRIGVGAPETGELSEYVLSDFSSQEEEILDVVFEFCEILLEDYLSNDFDRMIEKYSKLKISYSEKIKNSQDQK